MGSSVYSLVAIFALATISFTMVHAASSQTQISLTSFGNTDIDLAWDEQDRILRSWTEISNFNPSDGSFAMQIVHESGKVVSDSSIQIITHSPSSAIDYKGFVMYMINAEDICQNEEFNAETSSWKECNPLIGKYEMHVSTNDGSALGSTSFNIVDSRV